MADGLTSTPQIGEWASAQGQPRESLGRWVDADGGGLAVDDNIARSKAAMEQAIGNRPMILNAMYRFEVGIIDFEWGTPGEGADDYAHGARVSHIMAKHGETVARFIPVLLAKSTIRRNPRDPETKQLVEHDDHEPALVRKNTRRAWVLAGFSRRQVDR